MLKVESVRMQRLLSRGSGGPFARDISHDARDHYLHAHSFQLAGAQGQQSTQTTPGPPAVSGSTIRETYGVAGTALASTAAPAAEPGDAPPPRPFELEEDLEAGGPVPGLIGQMGVTPLGWSMTPLSTYLFQSSDPRSFVDASPAQSIRNL